MNDIQEKLDKIRDEFTAKHTNLINQQIPIRIIETAIKIAGSAPSGANQQPWTYVLITDESVKEKLAVRLDNDTIQEAPFIIVLFKQNHGVKINEDGTFGIVKHYYAHDSVSLSAGMLLGAFHYANISYDLLPINKELNDILLRPDYETAILSFSIKGIRNTSEDVERKITDFYEITKVRRSIRRYRNQMFSQEIIRQSIELIDKLLESQSYHFECISEGKLKEKIRERAEENEKRLYEELISDEWRNALASLKTNCQKHHLTEAPYLVIVFSRKQENVFSRKQENVFSRKQENVFSRKQENVFSRKQENVFSRKQENVFSGKQDNKEIIDSKTMTGIATGLLIEILHYIGLSTLTYTPSPMKFLNDILDIPTNLTPVMVLPVGYIDNNYELPDIKRKKIEEILINLKS